VRDHVSRVELNQFSGRPNKFNIDVLPINFSNKFNIDVLPINFFQPINTLLTN